MNMMVIVMIAIRARTLSGHYQNGRVYDYDHECDMIVYVIVIVNMIMIVTMIMIVMMNIISCYCN